MFLIKSESRARTAINSRPVGLNIEFSNKSLNEIAFALGERHHKVGHTLRVVSEYPITTFCFTYKNWNVNSWTGESEDLVYTIEVLEAKEL